MTQFFQKTGITTSNYTDSSNVVEISKYADQNVSAQCFQSAGSASVAVIQWSGVPENLRDDSEDWIDSSLGDQSSPFGDKELAGGVYAVRIKPTAGTWKLSVWSGNT